MLWPTELKRHLLDFEVCRFHTAFLLFKRAEDGAQTRDPQLGRLVLYQLSYFRILSLKTNEQCSVFICGHRWIRTTEGESQQIYSLPHLATLEYAQDVTSLILFIRKDIVLPDGDSYRIQTYNLLIRSQMLYSVELTSHFVLREWALTDSNRRPSACKADALNQLS